MPGKPWVAIAGRALIGPIPGAACCQMSALLYLLAGSASATSGGNFELELGLKQRGLPELEQRFWSIADPTSEEYLQHLSRRELAELLGAEPSDVAAAAEWLRALGAGAVSVGGSSGGRSPIIGQALNYEKQNYRSSIMRSRTAF